MKTPLTLLILLAAFTSPPGAARASGPFDERTLERIQDLNRVITEHYEELESSSHEHETHRAIASSRIGEASARLEELEEERNDLRRLSQEERPDAERALEERRIDAKSMYLEALAEKHAVDQESIESFEVHASGILENLERLGEALEGSTHMPRSSEKTAREALRTVQQGTAVALSTLEEWGALTREDPRFRALWATARVLSRNATSLRTPESLRLTVELVRERTFVVRSLIDQARALRSALDQRGLLLQVAAQNQMLRLQFLRLGAINGMELPDLGIEESMRQILEDIEEEPFVTASESGDALIGFDDCLSYGACQ